MQTTTTSTSTNYVWTNYPNPITTGVPYSNYGTQSYISGNDRLEALEADMANVKKELEKNKKEKKSMFKNLTNNLKCGRVTDVRMSIYGLAFQNSDGSWYSVDKNGVFTDVTDLLFNESFCYMMPVAKSAVKAGDIVLYEDQWIVVHDITESGAIEGVNTYNRLLIHLMPIKSPFGFEFYTKLFPLVDFQNMTATSDNPFGNLPMLMMLNGDKGDDMLPFLLMQNKEFDMSNPMMLYYLMKDKKDFDILPFLMANQMKTEK